MTSNISNTQLKMLIVEDSLPLAKLYETVIGTVALEIKLAECGKKALELIKTYQPDIILLDLNLPDISGMQILRKIREEKLEISVIVMTANGSVNFAVEAMRLGAYDFLEKPIAPNRLRTTIKNTIEKRKLNNLFNEINTSDESLGDFIGSSPVMQVVYSKIRKIKNSRATVFITGESGTGKEVTAQTIHNLNTDRKGPFVPINCAAIPRELMESEIFGHVKGAFTGANTDRDGAVSLANHGTLFLDEICEMDLELQSKLLRFIQTFKFKKVGGSRLEEADVRIICATNRNPLQEVKEGRFREDLYYRLYVLPIHLPPLRERDRDMIAFAKYFISYYSKLENKNFTKISESAQEFLINYSWPGNVRQLQNLMYRCVVLNQGDEITLNMLTQELKGDGHENIDDVQYDEVVHNDNTSLLKDNSNHNVNSNLINSSVDKSLLSPKNNFSESSVFNSLQTESATSFNDDNNKTANTNSQISLNSKSEIF